MYTMYKVLYLTSASFISHLKLEIRLLGEAAAGLAVVFWHLSLVHVLVVPFVVNDSGRNYHRMALLLELCLP